MASLLKIFVNIIYVVAFLNIYNCETTDDTTTPEPDAAAGCAAPAIRYTRPKPGDTTTETTFVQFETTQLYLPEDFTTSDVEFVEKIDIDLSSVNGNGGGGGDGLVDKYVGINPYRIEPETGDANSYHGEDDDEHDEHDLTTQQHNRRRNKKRRTNTGRRRVENENGQSGRSGRGRYERHVINKRDTILTNDMDYDRTTLSSVGDIYYVDIDDLVKSKSLNKNVKKKLHSLKKKHKYIDNNKSSSIFITDSDTGIVDDVIQNEFIQSQPENDDDEQQQQQQQEQQQKKQTKDDFMFGTNDDLIINKQDENFNENSGDNLDSEANSFSNLNDKITDYNDNNNNNNNSSSVVDQDNFQRVKRKSGKTTGALSRPKGAGDTGSKSTSRKGDKDKGHEGDEGNFGPYQPDEEDVEDEDSEEEESDENAKFSEVAEIRFPGEVGPLGDRRLCKLRCVKGKWVGPLCATNEEDEHGHIKFQPLYKSCHVNRIPPHLLLSYRNISVNVGWDLPHGHSLQARCKDLGLYKLLGESRVLCSNGLWAPRMPSCVPTTLLTNFSDDSPPSIRIKIGSGSGAFEPSGVLAVLPDSTIHLDCMYPRSRGDPEWTWTGWFKQYYTGWSKIPDEQNIKYRLTIKDIQNQDSGTFTCASPRGLTNSIPIIVATSQCPQLPEPQPPLNLRLEGNKLGQRALYRCPLGFRIDGTINSTCLASGNWSSPPPTCQSVQCPPLYLEDPHLSLTELNTSAWGRAVFKCQWGFKLSGPPGLECEPTGVWSGPVPRCRAIQCPQPLVPINGRIDGTSGSASHRRYAVGALVTFSCTEGHLLVGEASIVCTETGFWSHSPPFCKSQCPYPGDPPNGLIAPLKFHYDPGDFLSVQCRPGFVEFSTNGPPERPRCLPDGQWSGPVPQCRSYEDV